MEKFEVKTDKTEYVILHEMRSISGLITRRQEWLNKPENKLKGTYKVVLKDTKEMQEELAELRVELAKVQV
jgi:uncharacterized protein YlxW (UPF0749 family)